MWHLPCGVCHAVLLRASLVAAVCVEDLQRPRAKSCVELGFQVALRSGAQASGV